MTRRGLILFVALGVAWGIPYLFIKIAVGELEPAMVVFARSGLAALLLLPIALFRREVAPVLRRWKPMLAYTIVEIIVPWYFLSSAEQHLPSSTAGLLLAAVPLAGVGIAALMGRPVRLSAINIGGIVLGMLGVAALVGLDVGGSDLLSVAEVGVVVVGYALGPAILSRWVPDLPGVGVVAVSLAGAALAYIPVVLFTGAIPTAWPSSPVIVSIVVLAVVCSALAFLLMVALIGEIGPVKATAITYVNPAVAVAAGVLILGEAFTIVTALGFGLVLAGSWLVTRRGREPATLAEPSPLALGAIVVMGVSGAGKTTIARMLAEDLHVRFIDADDLHSDAARAKMAGGTPLDDADRQPWLERVAAAAHEAGDVVVACSALKRRYRDALRAGAPGLRFVELDVSRAELARRLASRTGHFMPTTLLDSQLDTLEPLADDEAGVRVTAEEHPEAVVSAARAALLP